MVSFELARSISGHSFARTLVRSIGAISTLVFVAALSGCNSGGGGDTGSSTSPPPQAFAGPTIKTLSNRADMVSGGDALVEIVLPFGVATEALRVDVGGRDVTGQFAVRPSAANRIVGLITGLANGNNVVTARAAGATSTLTINNHPIGGPVYSGPQILPWVCATPVAQPASGNTPASNASGLSTTAVDAQCNIATEYKLWYKTTTANCSAARPDPNPPAYPR